MEEYEYMEMGANCIHISYPDTTTHIISLIFMYSNKRFTAVFPVELTFTKCTSLPV